MWKENEKTNTRTQALPIIGTARFTAEVLESSLPVLVSFGSPWSQPCQIADPILHEIAGEWVGKIKVVKVNADDSLDLSLGYEIRFVPTLLYFVGGKPRERIIGTASKEAILAKLKTVSEDL
jgi:thioredoxin 1